MLKTAKIENCSHKNSSPHVSTNIMADPIGPPLAHDVKVRELTNDEREAVVIGLLKQRQNGQLKRGAIIAMAHDLNVSHRCISRIWNKVSLHVTTAIIP